MVVTTKMYHQMVKSEPTIQDIDKIDLELHNKSAKTVKA
jgi:hypothetical protein